MVAVDLPVPRYRPMLASSGLIRGEATQWAFEPKLDGWRAMVTIVAGKLKVSTRHGNDVTSSVPELQSLSETDAFFGRSVVLDGELVAHDGKPSSFYRLSGRMAARNPGTVATAAARTPASFVAFDVLWNDADVTKEPYRFRRSLLESFALSGPSWCAVSSFEGAGAELFAACDALKLEGLVAKRLDSPYEPGVRSKHWVKAKCSAWLEHHASHRHG